MDPLSLLGPVALGALLGAAAGLVPGLHANTAVLLLAALSPGAPGLAVLLVALAVVHNLVSILPATYLGVPGEDANLAMLPAHRMLHQRQARAAVQVATRAALAATALGILLALPLKWVWAEPGRAGRALQAFLPWLLGAIPLWLVWGERHRGARGMAASSLVLLLSGLAGVLASATHPTPILPIPATPLAPLLSGLFGGAGLLVSALTSDPQPGQDAPPRRAPSLVRRSIRASTVLGVLASAATVPLPGVTPAIVASTLPRVRGDDPRPTLATLSAVGATQPLFAFLLLWLTGQARTGLALAVQAAAPVEPWTVGRPPDLLLDLVMAWLGAALLGIAIVAVLDGPVARHLPRLPPRPLCAAALAVLVGVTFLLSGWIGLAVFAAAAAVGLLPLSFGVRRVHLTGALLAPILLSQGGFTG
jgi:putative membrane protein